MNRKIIDLSGEEGNAFVLLGYVGNIGKQLGWSREYIEKIEDEMTESDYENLLNVFEKYMNSYFEIENNPYYN